MSTTKGIATIGPDLVVQGRIGNCRTLDVLGYVEGGIEAEEVRIHPGGRVFGTVKADRMEVNGALQGDILVKNLISIGSTGVVNGNVRYGQLAMSAGGELSADVRNVPPEIHGDLQVAVRRGRAVPITLADLTAVDPDDTAERLHFIVGASTGGAIALAEAPETPVAGFSQADLAAGRVLFVHDGSTGATAGFDVSVSDAAGAATAPQHITVSVIAAP